MTDARCYECRNVVLDDDRAIGCSACPGVAGNFSPLDEIPPGKYILVTISPREEQPRMLFPRGEFRT